MEQMCSRVKNYHVSVKEMGNQIVFLRKLERGGTEHSFGIHAVSYTHLWYFDLNARCAVRMSLMRSMTWAFLAFNSSSNLIGVEILSLIHI